ncbi:transcriptional regulator CprB [Microbacterium aurantiacum]
MTKRPTYPKGREQMPEADVVKRANGLATQRLLLSAAGSIFSRMPYAEARLKDIADEADISPGSLYFHFGNKDDIAKAVISIQQERMGEVLERANTARGTALDRLLQVMEGLAELIASDELVQAGIRLSVQPDAGTNFDMGAPYAAWESVTAQILRDGSVDGSMAPDLDHKACAELLNEIFVGAQSIAGIMDKWASLPRRIAAARESVRLLVTTSPRW